MSRMFASGKGNKIRKADHAGSWYTDDPQALRAELQGYLNAAPKAFHDDPAPVKHARVIIAPHAGYRYSGPTAGVAYKALALDTNIMNVFVLGPSHHVYLETAAVSGCDELETPLGNLLVNKAINVELQRTDLFKTVSKNNEEAEHSMEMHFPFVKLLIDSSFANLPNEHRPRVVPIMIGNASASTEKMIGEALVPYLRDRRNVFVVSSDFAHWGRRFGYTYYVPKQAADVGEGSNLKANTQVDPDTQIHESISRVDEACMQAVSTGNHESFLHVLSKTGNTVCGRHPIGVMMAAITTLKKQFEVHDDLSRFVFTDYQRSSLVAEFNDSSVSYASAYAKVECMDVLSFVGEIEEMGSNEKSHSSTLRDGQHMLRGSSPLPLGVTTYEREAASTQTSPASNAARPAAQAINPLLPDGTRGRARVFPPRARGRGYSRGELPGAQGNAHGRAYGFRRTQRHMVLSRANANHALPVQSANSRTRSRSPRDVRHMAIKNSDGQQQGLVIDDDDYVSEVSKQHLRKYLDHMQLRRLRSDDSLRAHEG